MFLDVDGVQVYVQIMGVGFDFVLIYGVLGNICDMVLLLGVMLVSDYCVIIFDWFGFGYIGCIDLIYVNYLFNWFEMLCEQVDLLVCVVWQLGVENFIVVGYFFGGVVVVVWVIYYFDDLWVFVNFVGVIYFWNMLVDWFYCWMVLLFGCVSMLYLVGVWVFEIYVEILVQVIFGFNDGFVDYVKVIGVYLVICFVSMKVNVNQVYNLCDVVCI